MVHVDSPDLYRLSQELKGVDKKLAAQLRKELRAVAEPLRRAVATEASWSRRIPGATKVAIKANRKTSAVTVQVDRKKAPHARPLEHGSQGNGATVRHPLFGDTDHWVVQPTRPFFAKAIERQGGRMDAAIEQVAKNFERELGFH